MASEAEEGGVTYSRFRRLRRAYWFIKTMASEGSAALENTKSKHVAVTYGLDQQTIKKMKAKFRNELSFGDGK
jgi:hypothetical protein